MANAADWVRSAGPKAQDQPALGAASDLPYQLRGLTADRPNQVWATDITYTPMARGFLYLVAVMDWYSRYVLAWRLSNAMDTSFLVLPRRT
jgi:putative transposase